MAFLSVKIAFLRIKYEIIWYVYKDSVSNFYFQYLFKNNFDFKSPLLSSLFHTFVIHFLTILGSKGCNLSKVVNNFLFNA